MSVSAKKKTEMARRAVVDALRRLMDIRDDERLSDVVRQEAADTCVDLADYIHRLESLTDHIAAEVGQPWHP